MSCTIHDQATQITREERIARSPQYQDGKFQNAKQLELMDFGKLWGTFMDFTFGEKVDTVPTEPIPIKTMNGTEFLNASPEPFQFARIGHSTILFQMDGKVWITDPVFSKRASPVQWLGPERFHPTPLTIDELPELEGVIISHDHYDHLDLESIVELKDRTNYFLVPLGVGETIESWGVPSEKIKELDWWESARIGDVELVSTPSQHFSGRGLFNRNSTLWTSWVIRTHDYSVYFSGDSGYFEGFKEIGEKYGPFDITFLENGAYNERWPDVHMQPEETIQAHKDLKGKLMVPIHHGTFELAFHSWYEPMERITALGKQENVPVLIPYMGQVVSPSNPPATVAWWKTMKLRKPSDSLVVNEF